MAVTLTFDSTLSRVRISATGLAAADVATIERSTDQLRWTTVRGASAWPVTASALATPCDDYEFQPGVPNYYRVRGVGTAAIGFVGAGASSTGSSGSRTPGLPAGLSVGDVVLIAASMRTTGGSVNTPTDWTVLASAPGSFFKIFGRVYDGVWTMPTITFTGDTALEDTIAMSCAFRRMQLSPVSAVTQANSSQQNIAFPALTNTVTDGPLVGGSLMIIAGWKQDDWTSVDDLAGTPTEIGEAVSTAGNDAGQVWDYWRQFAGTTQQSLAADSLIVTGGAAAISRSIVLLFKHADYLNEQTANVTPSQAGVWLKNIGYPFLNRQVSVSSIGDVEIGSRSAAFEIVNRSDPIGITDLSASETWEMVVRAETTDDAEWLKLLLKSGDILLVQVPPGSLVPSGYVIVNARTTKNNFGPVNPLSHWRIPLRRTAAPKADVVPTTSTYQAIINSFATYSAVQAAFATYADMAAYVASPSDVIVP
jgi:hypothetical protein